MVQKYLIIDKDGRGCSQIDPTSCIERTRRLRMFARDGHESRSDTYVLRTSSVTRLSISRT